MKARLILGMLLIGISSGFAKAAPPSQREAVIASLEMVEIPEGRFIMGTDLSRGERESTPLHEVSIKSFRLAKTLVTFDQYDRFALETDRPMPQDEGWGRGNRPVINITRAEMMAFAAWLNADQHRHFRLPSEAEWEYAARAGTTTDYYWGDGDLSDYANTASDKGRDHFPFTSPVGSFLPNGWGLFDMAGNVWEMTEDCRHPDYHGAPHTGIAWMDGPCDSYIVRGGFYFSISRGVRVTTRAASAGAFRSPSLGFRLAEGAVDP